MAKVRYGVDVRLDAPLALDGVSLEIRIGEVIGFAGPSGSGKTTFARTLLRLVHPASGALCVGGVAIEQVTRQEIGQLFGFVGQTPFLFSGTIAENIRYGSSNPSLEDIACAAHSAHIGDEIEAWADSYQHVVTERGGNLSGGQRQRIALARVFLQNPSILVLDEATSGLNYIAGMGSGAAPIYSEGDAKLICRATHHVATARGIARDNQIELIWNPQYGLHTQQCAGTRQIPDRAGNGRASFVEDDLPAL